MSPINEMTFDDLSPQLKQSVLNARAVHDFFQSEIAPRLLSSPDERQRFAAAPTQYLISAGAPVLADLSAAQLASMDGVLAGPLPVGDAVGCWICTKAYEVLITTVVVIGMVLTDVLILALATAIAGPAGLVVGVVVDLILDAGMAIGGEILGPMVEKLATEVCNKTGGCP